MNFRTASKELLDLARQYKEDMDEARDYFYKSNVRGRLQSKGVMSDARDFLPMIALMGIKGDTKAERATDIHEKMDKMTEAFMDPDERSREEYLAMIYYLVDDFANDFDPVTMNMSDPSQVAKLLQGMLISQTIGSKKEEYPDFFNKKYPTPEARNLQNASERFMLAISSTVTTLLNDNGIKINVILSLPRPLEKENMEIHYLEEDYQKLLLDEAKRTKGDLPKVDAVDFPILDSMIPCVGKNVRDIRNFSDEQYNLVRDYHIFLVESTMLLGGSQNTKGMKDAGIEKATEAVYIDGKPYSEFEKAYLKEAATGGLQNAIIGVSILGGKHKVDIVQAYPNEAGEMQYFAKTMRFTVTPEQEKLYMQQFSWIHRTLFNWWPFRIETLQEKIDKMVNDPGAEARRASVLEMHKRKIEAGLAKRDEYNRQLMASKQRAMQHAAAFKEADARLLATAAQWDKDSVIGILGQQITATYEIEGSKQEGACRAIRLMLAVGEPKGKYEKTSPLFAKVLLYAHLCSERAANNGEPGAVEKALGTGSSVLNNIERTANRMANDPIFKNLVMEKLGDYDGGILAPQCPKYERLIANGGCEAFWLEYNQRIKEAENQKEEPALASEAQMQKQGAQKAPR